MSRIVLGVGASHATLMNTHWDEVADNPDAVRFRDALAEARDEIAAARPDLVIVVGSNHFRGLWLDLMPTFALGVGRCVAAGESGTPAGQQPVDVESARQLCGFLVDAHFDVAFSARLQIDHGQSHAIQYLLPGVDAPIVPLIVNVFAHPLPTLRRCAELGEAIARGIQADGGTKRVVVIGSGGLSHRLPWPDWRAPAGEQEEYLVASWMDGRTRWREYEQRRREIVRSAQPHINQEFDRQFLHRLETGDLGPVIDSSTRTIEDTAGNGAQELRTWVVMAAAASYGTGRVLAYAPVREWLTGMAVAVVEPSAPSPSGR